MALSPILFTLYLSSIFYIFKKWLKNLKIPISILSFIDDGLLISQNKFITVLNVNFCYSYNIISTLITKFMLIIKYRKIEMFYFSRLQEVFDPLSPEPYISRRLHSMPQEYLVLSWIYIQLKTIISTTY